MAYSYDQPLKVQYNYSTLGSTVIPKLAVSMAAEGGKRQLEGSIVLGFYGLGVTAGAQTLQIGDGVTVDRYGTFVCDTIVTDVPVSGVLTLTEEGYHMGVSNNAATPQIFVITPVGTGTFNGGMVVGYY
jgi:hypothetical protein